MLDNFLRKNFRVIRLAGIIIQMFVVAYYVVWGKNSLNERIVVLGLVPVLFVVGIVLTSILLGLQVISNYIPKKTFILSCNSFIISCIVAYFMLLIEMKTGNVKIAVLGSSSVIGAMLTSIFLKNRYADNKG